MSEELKKFILTPPEIVIEWQDDYSPARGWLVVNSMRGGAAGGGTRMRPGCAKEEVLELAKTMEIKFTVSGPEIGGAKSGIDYDYKDSIDKQAVLSRWFKHISRELKTCYGTGGDQNIDQLQDVIPVLEMMGIRHPQEGIVRGHLRHLCREGQNRVIANLRAGVSLPINDDRFLNSLGFTIADVATGYGVMSALEAFHEHTGSRVSVSRAIIEGFGNVGSAAAYYLYKIGIKVVGIIDKKWQLFHEDGLDIPNLLKNRAALFDSSYWEGRSRDKQLEIEDYPEAEIFVPAATSHTISQERVAELSRIGVKIITPGANNPFVDEAAAAAADESLSVIADFIANCGMARVFSYLMKPDCQVREKQILEDVGWCVQRAATEVLNVNNSLFGLCNTAEKIALQKIVNYDV